jgi:SH3-like domain-containing protein
VSEENNVAMVAGSALNVRSGPSKDSQKLFVLSLGEEVVVLEAGNSWTRVRTADARTGWVFSTVTETAPRKLIPGTATSEKQDSPKAAQGRVVRPGGVTVRSGPAKRNSPLFNLSGGEPVTILGEQDGWARIKDRSDRIGWAYSEYLLPS